MKARLRGHHLICLHFYHGSGYSERFINTLKQTINNASSFEVVVVSGPDDVCLMCPHLKYRRCAMNATSEDEVNAMDRMALSLLNLDLGQEAKWQDIRKRMDSFLDKWYKANCVVCLWRKVCTIKETTLINNDI